MKRKDAMDIKTIDQDLCERDGILEEIKAELIYERYAVDSDTDTFKGLDIAIQIIEEKINENR